MAENDFFLRFGSNAEDFGTEVESGVRRAYQQISNLSRDLDRLNTTLRESPARDFLSSLQDEMRGVSRTISRTLADELRTALRRELPEIARGLNLVVEAQVAPTEGGRRSNAGSTPEAARVSAEVDRAQREAQNMGQDTQRLISQTREALKNASEDTRRLFEGMSETQKLQLSRLMRLRAQLQSQEASLSAGDETPVRRGARQTREMALEDPARKVGDAANEIDQVGSRSVETAQQLDRLQLRIRDLSQFLAQVMQGRVDVEAGRKFFEQGATRTTPSTDPGRGSAAMDPETVQTFATAAATQLRAAETLERAAGGLSGNFEKIQALLAAQGTTAAAAQGTRPPPQAEAQQQVAQQTAQTANVASDVLSDARRYTGNLFAMLEPLRGAGGKGTTFSKKSRDFLQTDPAAIEASEGLSSIIGDEAMATVAQKLRSKSASLETVIDIVESALGEQTQAINDTTQSEREVAAANKRGAQAREAQTTAVEQGTATAREMGPYSRDMAERGPQGRQGQPLGPPVPTDIANRRAREASQRQMALRSIFDDAPPEGATGIVRDAQGQRVSRGLSETESIADQIAAEYAPVFDSGAVIEAAIDKLGIGGREETSEGSGQPRITDLAQQEIRQRMQDTFRNLDDDMVEEARRTLRQSTGRASPRLEGPTAGPSGTSLIGLLGSTMAEDPGFQRQRRFSRALQLADTTGEGPGSIEAATRGGSLEELNRRIAAAQAGGLTDVAEVSSRAEGQQVLGQMRADLQALMGQMTADEQQRFQQVMQLEQQERAAVIERLRVQQQANASLVEFTRALQTTGAVRPPRGRPRAPSLEFREEGDRGEDVATFGRLPQDPQMERVRRAQDILNLSEMRDSAEAVGRVTQAMTQIPDLSVGDIESLPQGTAQQGRIRRLAIQALEEIDQAVLEGVERSTDPGELASLQQFESGARAREQQRERQRVEDERVFEAKIQAAGRTERVQQGGLRALAGMVEAPDAARMGIDLPAGTDARRADMTGVALRRLSPEREDIISRSLGQTSFAENLIGTYNQAMEQAADLNRQRFLRSEAQQALEAGEVARAQGLPVDEREMASAERIVQRTEGVGDRLRATLERVLVPPDPKTQPEMFQAQQGRSVADLLFRGSADAMRQETAADVSPELTEGLAARRAMQDRLARQATAAGADLTDVPQRDMQARIQEALPDVDVGRSLIEAENLAIQRVRREQDAMRGRQEIDREFKDRDAALLRSSRAAREGPSPELLRESIQADESMVRRNNQRIERERAALSRQELTRQEREAEEARLSEQRMSPYRDVRQRAQPFLGREEEVRRAASGLGGEADFRSVFETMGGLDAVVERIGRQTGQIAGAEDVELRDVKEELREAPQALAQAEQRVREETERLAQVRAEKARLEAGVESGEIQRGDLTRDQRLLMEGREARLTTTADGRQMRTVGELGAGVTAAEAEVERQRALVQRREQMVEERRVNAERNLEGRAQVRAEVEETIAGGGTDDMRNRLQQLANTQMERMTQALNRLEAAMIRIGRDAGLTTGQARGAQSLRDLARMTMEGQPQRPVREGVEPPGEVGGRMTTTEAAELRARGVRPSVRIPATDAKMLELAEFLGGTGTVQGQFADPLKRILDRGREMAGVSPDDLGSRAGYQSRIRNQLGLLAGEGFEQFMTPDFRKRQGLPSVVSDAEGRRVRDQTTITPQLVEAAQAGARATEASLIAEGGLGDAQARAVENRTNEQIRAVLTQLEQTMRQLIECCRTMDGTAGGRQGRPTIEDARASARDRELLQSLSGRVQRETARTIGRGDLNEAAMDLMADPNLQFDANEARRAVQQIYNQAAEVTGGPKLGQDQMAGMSAQLDIAERFRGVSEGAFQAFRANDPTNTARAMVKAGEDIDGSLRLLRRGFGLTSEELGEMRGPMEAYQQELQQQKEAQEAAAPRELSAEEQLRRDQFGRGLEDRTGQTFIPGDEQSARNIGAALIEGGESTDQALKAVNRAFVDLDTQTRQNIETELRQVQAKRETSAATQRAAEAEERLQRLRNLLPAQARAQLDAGQLDARQVTEILQRQSPQPRTVSQAQVQGVQAIMDQGTAAAAGEQIAAAQGRTGVEAGTRFLDEYESTIQNSSMGAALFGPGGSLARNIVRTTGNYIGRFFGGTVVFGLANRLKQLVSEALEIEQTFIRVTAALEATGKAAEGVKDRLQEIAVTTNVDLASTYEVMAQLVGVFDDMNQAARATEVVAQLELISQGALSARQGYRALSAVATSFQETLMEDRGLDQEGAISYIADLTTRLQDLTGVNIEDTIEGVGRLGETANAMGIELEFLASTLAVAGKASGQSGRVVSEAFGRVLSQLQDDKALSFLVRIGVTDEETARARDFQTILEDLFESFDDLTIQQQQALGDVISDPRQFYIVNAALQQGSNILETYGESMNNSGAAAARTEEILGTLRGQIGQLGKQVQVFVENLVDMGALNAFGVLVFGARNFLELINNILQLFNRIRDSSPFFKMGTDLAFAAGGLLLLMRLMDSMFAQMGRFVGVTGSTGFRDTFGGFRAQRARRAEAATQPTLFDAPQQQQRFAPVPVRGGMRVQSHQDRINAQRAARHAQQRAAGTGPGIFGRTMQASMRGVGIQAARLDRAFPRLENGMRRLARGTVSAGRALGRMAPQLMVATLALSLFFDWITKEAREMEEWISRQYRETPRPGETQDEVADRIERENVEDFAQRAMDQDLTFREAFGQAIKQPFQSWSNFGDALIGRDGGAIDRIRGVLDEDVVDYFDAYQDEIDAAVEAGDVEALAEIAHRANEEAHDKIEEQETTAQQYNVMAMFDDLLERQQEELDELIRQQLGLDGVFTMSNQQIDDAVAALSFTQNLNNRARAQFGGLIAESLDTRDLPREAAAMISGTNRMGMGFQERIQAQISAQDMLLEDAHSRLRIAYNEGLPDKIAEANQRIEAILQTRMQLEDELIQAAIDLPAAQADYAARFGMFAEAERFLEQQIQGIREQIAPLDAGDPARIQGEAEILDIIRQQVEHSIQGQILMAETMAAMSQDPLVGMQGRLEVARTRLEAAIANPGAFSPEEIAGFVQEIAGLQQEIADQQEGIAAALANLRQTQERNPLRRANLEYAEAMRQYQRAIDEGLGGQAILEAAAAAEDAATALRQEREAIRAATASLRITTMPPGDSFRVAMAQLEEAFVQQVAVIREYGRDSSEFMDTMENVINLRREAEQAVNEIASAHAAVAISLANAAGLNIEAARLQLGEAQRELQQALAEAGGNRDAAIVQQAMSAVIDAEAQMRDTVLGEAMSTIDFLMEMEDITANEAIGALRAILDTMDLTEEQRRTLMRRIKGLQDDLASSLSGGFNIADVRLPTPYEVRRSLGIDAINEGLDEAREAMSEARQQAQDEWGIGEAGSDILDRVLGDELANEVRNVGQGVDALLPPLSEVPTLVQETIANRDAIVAQAERQVETLIANRTANNAAIQQLGATIKPPMDQINDELNQLQDLSVAVRETLDLGNGHLVEILGEGRTTNEILESLPEGIAAALREVLEAEVDTRGMDLPSLPPGMQWGSGGLPYIPGRWRGGPVSANKPYRVGEYGEEYFIPNTSGLIVRTQDLMPRRDPMAGGGGASVSNTFQTSVTVNAESNANPDQIARAVEKKVTSSLKRSINANQSTPHLVRMR